MFIFKLQASLTLPQAAEYSVSQEISANLTRIHGKETSDDVVECNRDTYIATLVYMFLSDWLVRTCLTRQVINFLCRSDIQSLRTKTRWIHGKETSDDIVKCIGYITTLTVRFILRLAFCLHILHDKLPIFYVTPRDTDFLNLI